MVNNIDLRLERKNPRITKLNNALEPSKNIEGRVIKAIKKYPLTRLVRLHSALLKDIPNTKEKKNNILSRMMK